MTKENKQFLKMVIDFLNTRVPLVDLIKERSRKILSKISGIGSPKTIDPDRKPKSYPTEEI